MARYGSDRPDRRFGLELHDVGELVRGCEFRVFASVLEGGGVIRALNAGARELSRSELDGLNAVVQRFGAAAVAPIPVTGDAEWGGNLAKFFTAEHIAAVNAELDAHAGDLLLFVADREAVATRALGELRLELGERFGLIDPARHDVLWVVEFPMFEFDEAQGRFTAMHHPFTAPAPAAGTDVVDFSDPARAALARVRPRRRRRRAGRRLDPHAHPATAGAGLRSDRPRAQQEAQRRFGFLLDALRYGAPPHGGIALGIDRIVAMIAGTDSIRDVIAFPKAASGADPMTGAPAPVDPVTLRDLGLRGV